MNYIPSSYTHLIADSVNLVLHTRNCITFELQNTYCILLDYTTLVGFYIGTNTHSAYLYLKLFETLVITKDYVTDKCIPCIHLVVNNWCVEKNGCHFVPFVSDSSTKWTRIVSVL